MSGAAQAAPGGTGGQAAAPLDDVMLAMDVVDSLRHADKLVERELSTEERDRQLKERLRQLYSAQGIDVPERILDEGVAALREDRFVYRPPASGFKRSLALVWVTRGRWLKALAIAAGILVAIAGGWYVGVKLPAERQVAEQTRELTETLPRQLQAERDRVLAVSKVEEAKQQARALAADGEAALKAGDAAAARRKLAQLTALREKLEQSYVLRIVSKPQQSAVWRVPRLNPAGRNYYILVEAVDGQGRPVAVDITSEEDNKTARGQHLRHSRRSADVRPNPRRQRGRRHHPEQSFRREAGRLARTAVQLPDAGRRHPPVVGGMLSGLQVLGSIDEALLRAQQQAGGLDRRIGELNDRLLQLRKEEGNSYRTLARVRLSAPHNDQLIQRLTAIDGRVRAALQQRSSSTTEIDSTIAAIEAEAQALQAERGRRPRPSSTNARRRCWPPKRPRGNGWSRRRPINNRCGRRSRPTRSPSAPSRRRNKRRMIDAKKASLTSRTSCSSISGSAVTALRRTRPVRSPE